MTASEGESPKSFDQWGKKRKTSSRENWFLYEECWLFSSEQPGEYTTAGLLRTSSLDEHPIYSTKFVFRLFSTKGLAQKEILKI